MHYLTKISGRFDELSKQALDNLPDGAYTIDKKKNKRSLDQNNALWRWDTELSQESGYTPSEVHYIMLGRIYGTKDLKVGNSVISKPIKTSSELTTVEFSQYIEIYTAVAFELFNITLSPFSYDKNNV
jgi:hypothetical protein